MSQATFSFLCNELPIAIQRTATDMRKVVPVEQSVSVLGNQLYPTIGYLFGVSKATVCCVIEKVCAVIVDIVKLDSNWQ